MVSVAHSFFRLDSAARDLGNFGTKHPLGAHTNFFFRELFLIFMFPPMADYAH